MSAMHVPAVAILGLAVRMVAAEEIPEALQKFYEHRAAIRTAVADIYIDRDIHGMLSGTRYAIRMAGADVAQTDFKSAGRIAQPAHDWDAKARSVLRSGNYVYANDHDKYAMRSGAGLDAREGVMDIRSLGASVFSPFDGGIDSALLLEDRQRPFVNGYSQRQVGDLIVVDARIDEGVQSWWIDPAKDYNAVRITFTTNSGQVLSECRNQLEQIDGVWFPHCVTYERSGQITDEVCVDHVEFNRPEHPQELTPNDIGIKPGMLVMDLLANPGDPALIWDGEKSVPANEYAHRQLNRALESDAENSSQEEPGGASDPSRMQADDPEGPPADSDHADAPKTIRKLYTEWQKYTRDFIDRHKLDDRQTRRAWKVLRDCERQGDTYVRGRRGDIEEVESAIERAATDTSERRKGELEHRMTRLIEPMNEIFRKRLVPGLDGLLTAEQRRAARESAKSAPKTRTESGNP